MQYLGATWTTTEWSWFVSKGKPFIITVIQVYAPTTNAEESKVDQVLCRHTPFRTKTKKDVLFIIEDWTAKVGIQEIPGITGKFGLGIQNEAGQSLTEFCQENTLVTTITRFQQPKRRLYTWTSPDGQYHNPFDYVLCSQRWKSSMQSAKTRPGADYGSDHEPLIAKFRLKLKKVGETTRPLKSHIIYTVEVINRFRGLDLLSRRSEELCMEVHNIIEEAVTETQWAEKAKILVVTFGAVKALLQGHVRRLSGSCSEKPLAPWGFWQSIFKG